MVVLMNNTGNAGGTVTTNTTTAMVVDSPSANGTSQSQQPTGNSSSTAVVAAAAAGGGGGAFTRNQRRKLLTVESSSSLSVSHVVNYNHQMNNNDVAAAASSSSSLRASTELLRHLQQQQPTQPQAESSRTITPSPTTTTTTTNQMSIHHQVSSLHFGYSSPTTTTTNVSSSSPSSQWCGMGTTTLYVTTTTMNSPNNNSSSSSTTGSSASNDIPQQLALHLRGCCSVQSIQVESCTYHNNTGHPEMTTNTNTTTTTASTTTTTTTRQKQQQQRLWKRPQLQVIPNIYYGHVDPIQHVLVRPIIHNNNNGTSSTTAATAAENAKPPTTTTTQSSSSSSSSSSSQPVYSYLNADAQSSRGAAGMTTALRAASIASNIYGELRIHIPAAAALLSTSSNQPTKINTSTSSNKNINNNQIYEMWKHDIEQTSFMMKRPTTDTNNYTTPTTTTTTTTTTSQNLDDDTTNTTLPQDKQNQRLPIQQQLQHELSQRNRERRQTRIALIAQQLTNATMNTNTNTNATNNNSATNNNTSTNIAAAYKITIQYHISGLEHNDHLGGLQAATNTSGTNSNSNDNDITPYLYTVTGNYGDSEGTRCYLPTLDSASVRHRASHILSISITSSMQYGLSVVGCGEDSGISETILYQNKNVRNGVVDDDAIQDELGIDMIPAMLRKLRHVQQRSQSNDLPSSSFATTATTTTAGTSITKDVHIIPPTTFKTNVAAVGTNIVSDTAVHLDQIMATTLWCSQIWSPIPCRSIGFAIGPFKMVDDPDYIHQLCASIRRGMSDADNDDNDDDNDDDDDNDNIMKMNGITYTDRQKAFIEKAMKNGEGIRHVYLAPKFERKYIYITTAMQDGSLTSNSNHRSTNRYRHCINTKLLPNTIVQLIPLSSSQLITSHQIQQSVMYATTGVPHRALSLMRDILSIPHYRTTSYTQIFLPNAVHGGCTSGAFHHCPEVLVNAFIGGAIMDSRLLPPVHVRLPYYQGGRVLQFLQARCAVRGWITAALPLGGHDDVGNGYLLTLFESFIMSLYQRGHGGCGEGGGKHGYFYSRRFASNCGLSSTNLDFLPVQNVEEEVVIDGIGAVPVEERINEQLWRGAINGSESHTSAFDEYCIRQLLCKDGVEALERGTDRDKGVPSPSMGWFGSFLALTFLSSNASSSSDLGCGAVDMLHPIGGLVYRTLKCELLRSVVEGRTGVANFIRLIRVTFIAAHLGDIGEKEVQLPKRKRRADSVANDASAPDVNPDAQDETTLPTQPFVICVNEVLKKKGLTHTLFTRALQTLSGRIKEPLLVGSLVDVERHAEDPRIRGPFVAPEGFPNSFVRGASMLFCRVGVQVETARDASASSQTSVSKGIQMQAYAEPVIPEGGIAYGGPITIRVVENEGSFREYVKDLASDGSRRDWGTTFLHAKPVTTGKAQTAASGTIERTTTSKDSRSKDAKLLALDNPVVGSAFTDNDFHGGGYQSIELIRLTNLTPLLWVRVDPAGQYGGRISVFQPDACLAEQLFHDGDASAQIEAIRALAERPLRVQVVGKVTSVYDVNVGELPVRLLGDCLRGSPALHSSLPHTPAVRVQAALAIAQWQNNKNPPSKDSVGAENWVGLNILLQYFRERFYSNKVIMPTKYSRLVFKKNEEEVHQAAAAADGGASTAQPSYDTLYEYLDTLDDDIRKSVLETAEVIELEEDEEYRVRSAVVTAIASIRAKDGLTPTASIKFLETLLESEDAEMVGNIVYDDENRIIKETYKNIRAQKRLNHRNDSNQSEPSLSYCSSPLVADTLLALCHINAMPAVFVDPTTGKGVQSKGDHPMYKLFKIARSWLEWELYRENIRFEIAESTKSGISGNTYDTVAACSIIAISNMAILMQSTTDATDHANHRTSSSVDQLIQPVASAKFYIDIFDSEPIRNDLTRAACAQALSCICCAADRLEMENVEPVGLLTSLELLLDRIIDIRTSLSLKQTLSLIMMDSCTGKVCSMQRVGAIAGKNDLVASVTRFFLGPLGACHGGDNGSAAVTAVSAITFPAASAVNDGARRGMRLLSRAGHPSSQFRQEEVVRVAIFATRLWRTINGEPADVPQWNDKTKYPMLGVCAYNGMLRCSLLALWQWIWPKGCFALLQVQSWGAHENTPHYRNIGAHHVMKISDADKAAATAEDDSLSDLNRLVEIERDRQVWRGEMAQKAYDNHKASKGQSSNLSQDLLAMSTAAAEKGIGQPLPPIARDAAFKQGGWIASAAQQRRSLALDGGTAVTKLRLKKD